MQQNLVESLFTTPRVMSKLNTEGSSSLSRFSLSSLVTVWAPKYFLFWKGRLMILNLPSRRLSLNMNSFFMTLFLTCTIPKSTIKGALQTV